jgi:hypothetical protein
LTCEQEKGMTSSVSGALAVELRPHSPAHWIATYYPMVETPAGRWADVTWILHQCRIPPPASVALPRAQWLELRSPDPGHHGYANHPAWRAALASGYAAALAVYIAEADDVPAPTQQAQRPRAGTVVVPAGQLSEWVLEDLDEETMQIPR